MKSRVAKGFVALLVLLAALSACRSPEEKLQGIAEEASSGLSAAAMALDRYNKGDVPQQYARKMMELTSDDLEKLEKKAQKSKSSHQSDLQQLFSEARETLEQAKERVERRAPSPSPVIRLRDRFDDFSKTVAPSS